jgi:hypothetical protein
MKVGFSLLVLAFVLIGLTYSALRAQGISSPTNTAGRAVGSETRKVGSGIRAIDLSGPIDLTLRQGAVPSLVVRGEQRMLANVETISDSDGTLHIGTKGMLLYHRQPLQVTLVLPSIEEVMVHGSGTSSINGFSGERIEVNLNGTGKVKFNGRFKKVDAGVHGSGDLEMNGGASDKVEIAMIGSGSMTVVGSCKQFTAEQTGSGDLNARHLSADAADLQLMGSGEAILTARKVVNVSVRGSGDVVVYGSPSERNVSRNGSGEVTFKP